MDIRLMIDEIEHHYRLRTDAALAERLGVTKMTIHNWAKGIGKLNVARLLLAFPDLNAEWLQTGEGPMIRGDISIKAGDGSNVAAVNTGTQSVGVPQDKYDELLELYKQQVAVNERLVKMLESK